MACTTLTNITKSCDNNLGGLVSAYIFDMDDVATLTEDLVNWDVTALTLASGTKAENFEFKKNVASYTVASAIDLTNGSTYYTATTSLVFHRREAAKSKSLNILAAGQRYLGIIAQDANGLFWLITDAQLTTDEGGSGTAKADGSNYTITLVGEMSKSPLEVSTVIAASTLIVAP